MYESLIRNQNITFRNTFHILEQSSEWIQLPLFTSSLSQLLKIFNIFPSSSPIAVLSKVNEDDTVADCPTQLICTWFEAGPFKKCFQKLFFCIFSISMKSFLASKVQTLIYETVADGPESWVWWRADFQSGSEVLKKVFWTFSYLYL